MALVDTHVGYVESWECDTNDHLNVRYYAKRYDEALEMLCALAGQPSAVARCRHVRFHRELRFDALTRVRSARVVGGPADGRVVHLLIDASTDAVAATALDLVDALGEVPTVAADEVAAAMPRSVPLAPAEPADAVHRLERGAATVSNVRVADPSTFDAAGRYRTYEFISGFSDGGAHAWAFAGVTGAYLNEHRHGRIAVEQKLTIVAPVTPGMVLRQISWIHEVAPKSVAIVHQVDDVRTGTVLARGDVRAMLLDFATRRSVPIPDMVRVLEA